MHYIQIHTMITNDTMYYTSTLGEFELQSPVPADARAIWSMADALPDLDSNSPYAYLLLCSHFAATGLVARRGGELAGFALGYQRPDDTATAFVWQIAVAEGARGCGLGRTLLDRWFARCAGALHTPFLEATVTPSNTASRALFSDFAAKRGAALKVDVAFPSALFPEAPTHEAEFGFRIGPMTPDAGGSDTGRQPAR
jgi:L-2,4-diaminobutyric acid acetyltransferase